MQVLSGVCDGGGVPQVSSFFFSPALLPPPPFAVKRENPGETSNVEHDVMETVVPDSTS